MMYEKDDLMITTPMCDSYDGECDDGDHWHTVDDARSGGMTCHEGTVFLPASVIGHEWVIGDRDKVELLIADLKAILEVMN